MRPATAAEAAEVDAAVAELRRQYRAAGEKVAANTSGWFLPPEAAQVAAAFRQVGEVLERWATVHRKAALSGRWEDGREHSVQAFLDFGRREVADAVEKVAGEAYDRSLFAAVKYAASSVTTPSAWPSWVKTAAYAGGALVVLVVAVNVARLVRAK